MKHLIIIAYSLFLLPLSAQELKTESAAERLLKVMEFKKNIIKGGSSAFFMIKNNLKKQNFTDEELAQVKVAFMDYMKKLANDPELNAKAIAIYNGKFTESELNKLIEFYQTPLGKKLLKEQPDIMARIMRTSNVLAKNTSGHFRKSSLKSS